MANQETSGTAETAKKGAGAPTPVVEPTPTEFSQDFGFVRVSVTLSKMERDKSRQSFCWAKPFGLNLKTPEGEQIPASKVGSIMIYGLSETVLTSGIGGGPSGALFVGFLRPRGLGGLYDFVPEETVRAALQTMGLTEASVPQSTYVFAEESQTDRKTARSNAAVNRLAQRLDGEAQSGGFSNESLLTLQQGVGTAGAGSTALQQLQQIVGLVKKDESK